MLIYFSKSSTPSLPKKSEVIVIYYRFSKRSTPLPKKDQFFSLIGERGGNALSIQVFNQCSLSILKVIVIYHYIINLGKFMILISLVLDLIL